MSQHAYVNIAVLHKPDVSKQAFSFLQHVLPLTQVVAATLCDLHNGRRCSTTSTRRLCSGGIGGSVPDCSLRVKRLLGKTPNGQLALRGKPSVGMLPPWWQVAPHSPPPGERRPQTTNTCSKRNRLSARRLLFLLLHYSRVTHCITNDFSAP